MENRYGTNVHFSVATFGKDARAPTKVVGIDLNHSAAAAPPPPGNPAGDNHRATLIEGPIRNMIFECLTTFLLRHHTTYFNIPVNWK